MWEVTYVFPFIIHLNCKPMLNLRELCVLKILVGLCKQLNSLNTLKIISQMQDSKYEDTLCPFP
jgi:hypothetical protein